MYMARRGYASAICFLSMFACLIIRTFQLVFSVGTIFFSHNKSAGTMFRLVFSAKRTGFCLVSDSEVLRGWPLTVLAVVSSDSP